MRRPALSVLLLFAVTSAWAEQPAAMTAAAKWTVDDVVGVETATDFQFAPDGRAVVWVKTTADKDKGEMVSHLVRTDLDGHRETVLTRGGESCLHPRWSPDSKLVAFASTRPATKGKLARKGRSGGEDDKTQLWLIDPYGGEPWTLSELSRSIVAFDWAGPDHVIVVAQEDATLREANREERRDGAVVIEDEKNEPPARLFKILRQQPESDPPDREHRQDRGAGRVSQRPVRRRPPQSQLALRL